MDFLAEKEGARRTAHREGAYADVRWLFFYFLHLNVRGRERLRYVQTFYVNPCCIFCSQPYSVSPVECEIRLRWGNWHGGIQDNKVETTKYVRRLLQ